MPLRRVRPSEVTDWLTMTYDSDPSVRSHAVRELCPCHVKTNIEQVRERIFELRADPDPARA